MQSTNVSYQEATFEKQLVFGKDIVNPQDTLGPQCSTYSFSFIFPSVVYIFGTPK